MPYRLKGILKLPVTSQPAAGVDIEFISRRNYSPLLMDLSSIIKTSPTGAYDVTLEYGEYAVVLYWGCNQPSHIGKLFVFADTVAGLDLQTLLQQSDWQPATPEYIQQIQDWLASANSLNNQAIESAAAAKASEIAVEADRVEVVNNKNIVVSAQADVTSKRNDVTTKAAQVASNAAIVNEKTPLAVAAADTASQKAVSAATDAATASSAAIRAENAASAITGALVDGGKCNLSSGFYPTPVTVAGKKYSTVWYVQVGGTVGGITYDAGDVLRYTTADNSYFKVDAVDTTTAQINAHKVDPSAHAINTIIGLPDALSSKYSSDNKPTAIDVGIVAENVPISSSAGWYIIARVTMPQSAATSVIEISGGSGFNVGSFDQAVNSSIIIRSGNDYPKGITIACRSDGGASRIIKAVAWKSVAGDENKYDIYVNANAYGSNGLIYKKYTSKNAVVVLSVYAELIGVEKPHGLTDGAIVDYYSTDNKPTYRDVGADRAGTATQAITALKAEANPFPQYSDFVSGEPRIFASRAQLAKRSAQYHPLDGQLVPRSGDAGLLAAIIAGEVPSCPDADWLADKSKRGMYTLGDGSTNIRLPDWNGKSTDALGAPVIRGDGKNAAAAGFIQGDAIRNITGQHMHNRIDSSDGASGAFYRSEDLPWKGWVTDQSQSNYARNMHFDASRVVPTGPENRMVNTAGVHAVKR